MIRSLTKYCEIAEGNTSLIDYIPRDPNTVLQGNFSCPHAFSIVPSDAYCNLLDGDECPIFYDFIKEVAELEKSVE